MDMSQSMQTKQIEINITFDDLVAFNRYAAQRSPQVKRGYHFVLITVPVALLLISMLLYKYIPFIVPVEGQTKGVVGKHVIEISEKGLHETTEVNDSLVAWDGFDCIERNEQYIFAFISAMMAHIIPIRAFADTNQVTEFYSSMKKFFDQAKVGGVSAPPK
jgi:hypothetical protein